MARNRMVKSDFFDDEKLATISRDARLTYIGMWIHSDDYGVIRGNSAWLRNKIYPYDGNLTLKVFKGWLAELEKLRRIYPFCTESECFYYIPNFPRHQKINRPSKRRNPSPPDGLTEGSLSTHGGLTEGSLMKEKGKGKGKGKEKGKELPKGNSMTVPYDSIIELYHQILPMLPAIKAEHPNLRKFIKARWSEYKERQHVDWWKYYFVKCVYPFDFLTGRTDNPWKPDLLWLVKASNMPKVLNGNYPNDPGRGNRRLSGTLQAVEAFKQKMGGQADGQA